MKKNLFLKLIIFLCFGVGFNSCKKSDSNFEEKLLLPTDYIEVGSKTNKYSFEVLSNSDMQFSSDVDWIQLDSTALPKGKYIVKFTAVENEGEERTGRIIVKTQSSLEKEILVIQEAGLMSNFYVKPNATGTGRSWSEATDLNTALQNATSGSVIYLSEGTYLPAKTVTNGDPSNSGDKTFEINKNISLIGGYPADATTGATADPQLYKTIFSGKLSDGFESFHVVTISAPVSAGEKVSLDGITIKEGNATDRGINITINGLSFSRGNGGGMVIGGSNVLLKNIEILENKATAKSGSAGQCAGLYIFGNASVEMQTCKINANTNANNNGGGLWISESKAYIYNSEVNDNTARGTASGIHAFPDAELHMYNSVVKNNSNTSFGAGVYVRQNSKGYLVNCMIVDNVTTSANGGGGVMLYDNCSVDLISCTVSGNATPGPGGGIFRRQNTNMLTLINTIVSGNTQRSGSNDVDAFEATAPAPTVRGSVIENRVFSNTGAEVPSVSFDPGSMFDANYKLVGSNNPALTYGMDAAQLTAVGQTYNPPLGSDVATDMNGVSRTGKTIMGPIVQ